MNNTMNNQISTEDYKKLLEIAKDLAKKNFKETHDAQRATDFQAGLEKMLDICFFADYKKNNQ